uniref:Membrane palmitoylated protein 2 n=1 Tax=Pygocentrus nattereri TaxID=42514 RepID=A0AAR2J006_PYGNA
MQQVLENLGELPTSTGAKDIDLIFLKGIMESPIVRSLAKVTRTHCLRLSPSWYPHFQVVFIIQMAHERLEDVKLEAVQENNVELVSEILGDIRGLSVRDDSAAELSRILQEPHFQSLLEAHDMVASKCYEAPPPLEMANDAAVNNALMQADAVRMIGIRKKAGEPLGVTFRVEKDDLVIARILHGGMIDRQGLLHVGDIIKEVNGKEVGNNPTELQDMLKECSGGITLKILPSYRDAPSPPQVYVQPHFDYNPASDNLIPCKEAGLAFKRGDILQIVNREDPNWWQACHMVGGATGLIPSQFLEEKRKAFVPKDFDGTGILCGTVSGKKKKKMMYLTAKNAEFDRHELQIYEEVACMPPFQRKTLILIGAQGVGRRSLKNRLMVLHPTRYGTTVPLTSRRPREDERDGQTYQFVTRLEMEMDIKAGRFLEHGEYDGNLYGTKIESIHEVVNTGRTCILDVNPQALKVLKTAEFMPYVVFIAAPEFETLKAMHKAVVDAGITTKQLTDVDLKKTVDESSRIQRAYRHYFDLTIVNDNLDAAFEKLQAALDKLCMEPQWVPVNWVY